MFETISFWGNWKSRKNQIHIQIVWKLKIHSVVFTIYILTNHLYLPLICKPLVEVGCGAVRSLFPDSKCVRVKYPFLSFFPLTHNCLFSTLSKGSWITSFLSGQTLKTSFVDGISIINVVIEWGFKFQIWVNVSFCLFLMVLSSCFQSCWPVS